MGRPRKGRENGPRQNLSGYELTLKAKRTAAKRRKGWRKRKAMQRMREGMVPRPKLTKRQKETAAKKRREMTRLRVQRHRERLSETPQGVGARKGRHPPG